MATNPEPPSGVVVSDTAKLAGTRAFIDARTAGYDSRASEQAEYRAVILSWIDETLAAKTLHDWVALIEVMESGSNIHVYNCFEFRDVLRRFLVQGGPTP